MEQKKTLWIIAAVGVFLLVVVGAALILYSPTVHKAPVTTVSQPVPPAVTEPQLKQNDDNQSTPAATTASQSTEAPVSPLQSDKLTVISGNTTVYGTGTTTIDLNTLKSPTTTETVTPQNQLTAAVMNSVQNDQPSTVQQQPQISVAQKKVSPIQPEQKKSAAVPAKKAPAPAATAPKVPVRQADRWWVQVASYSAKKSADDARSALEANKISSEVFTYKDSKNKLFYRVRIGPYTTKSEAEYWQTRISYIDQFSKTASYVVNSTSKTGK
jgi:cell division protein FtsN